MTGKKTFRYRNGEKELKDEFFSQSKDYHAFFPNRLDYRLCPEGFATLPGHG